MLDCLRPVKGVNWDVLSFLSDPEDDEKIHINGVRFKEPGEYVIGKNEVQIYHIALAKENMEDPEKLIHYDYFEAGLVDPLIYLSELIPQGWIGFVAKKTSTSQEFVDDALASLTQFL